VSLVGASFFIATAACGTPQVVGDEACERYEVDIASFASCIDGKVVRPAPDGEGHSYLPAEEGSRYAVFFAADVDDRLTILLAAIVPGLDGASACGGEGNAPAAVLRSRRRAIATAQ
jgi:hypothetical protein